MTREEQDEAREPRGSTLPMSALGAKAVDSGALDRLSDSRNATRYTLLGEIARGGMGIVLHVWDAVLKRPLAMKVLDLNESTAGSGERSIARFLAEAQLSGSLEHPGVVPVHDLGVDEKGRAYFTMPLIEGRDLNEVFDLAAREAEGWSLTRALFVLTKICEVVAYAHARDVLHRDLKPANVMVGKFGEVYVMDWGLAKAVGAREPAPPAESPPPEATATDAARTIDGTVFGTPGYMAPEQAHGRVDEVTFLTDVYALGAMLYRLLAGRSPYAPRRGEEDAARTLELVRRGPPTPLARVAPQASPELIAIAEKAMAREPPQRYESVEALGKDLQAFLEGRVVGAYEGGLWAETKSLVRRNRIHAAWVGGLVVTAFAVMGIVTWVHAALNRDLERANAELLLARAEALPEKELTGEERELAAELADDVYSDERRSGTSWEVLTVPDAPTDDYLSALEHLREAARLVPGDVSIQARLGAALVRAGEHASGQEVLERALRGLDELDRDRARAFLGLAYCAQGRYTAAADVRRSLRESLEASRDPELHALAGELDRCLEKGP